MIKHKSISIYTGIILALLGAYLAYYYNSQDNDRKSSSANPQNVTLTGTYVCLPHIDTTGPQTEECRFGIKTQDGQYYAVNFGASADAMNTFQSGKSVNAEGFIVMKEALSSDEWSRYNMRGIFTITKVLMVSRPSQTNTKLDINVVCQHALTYMTFPTALMAEAFVNECKEGKHPEVIERYRVDMKLDVGATI